MIEQPLLFKPDDAALRERLAAIDPRAYARTRNHLQGAVTRLSPWITHGFLSLREVASAIASRYDLPVQHKLVYELGWRAWFHHAWGNLGNDILQSLHEGPLPDAFYVPELPDDIEAGRTGVPVIDQAVRTLYRDGWLHNHVRMWLASYVVHVRKVHWRTGADWMIAYLLDGDLASNHLSWQWIAGTGSHKPYLFNAENVARYAPPDWHSPGSIIDTDYASLDRLARTRRGGSNNTGAGTPATTSLGSTFHSTSAPTLYTKPTPATGFTAPAPSAVQGETVWLVHPWSLRLMPPAAETLSERPPVVIAVIDKDIHAAWPWGAARWAFVTERMAALTTLRWCGSRSELQNALAAARTVRYIPNPHFRTLDGAETLGINTTPAPELPLFPEPGRACSSFSQYWQKVTKNATTLRALCALDSKETRPDS
ncbi:MAG: FAD-binding domain-containing protein [Pseudomonadales bacterium]